MAKNVTTPRINESQYKHLKDIQKGITQTREYLLKCRKCKLDVDEELKATEDQLESISLLLSEFYPNQP